MKWTAFYCLCIACFVISGCHSTAKAGYTPTFAVSLKTTLFNEQLKQQDVSAPSPDFVKRYSLVHTGGQYYVPGMAKTNTGFNEKQLKKLHVRINTRAGGIFTIQVPLKNFNRFLNCTGIDYFEMSEKAGGKP